MSAEQPTEEVVSKFVKDIEEYPLHWAMHFYRAVAILSLGCDSFWNNLYDKLTKRLHLNPQDVRQILAAE
jgi:hypothetical protein